MNSSPSAGYANQQSDASRDAVLAALSDVVTTVPADQQHQRNGSVSNGASSRYVSSSRLNPANSPLPPGKDSALPEVPPALPSKKSSSSSSQQQSVGTRFGNAFRRNPDEKEAKRRAKEERMRDQISKSSAKNTRMDIIDRLDLSGLGGGSMFHHDSPYDAVSAHRNKGKSAPVLAFDPSIDPMTGQPWKHGQPRPSGSSSGNGASRSNLSPRAQATLARMDDAPVDDSKSGVSKDSASSTGVSVPALGMYDTTPTSESVPVIPSAGGSGSRSAAVRGDPDASADAERAWRYEQGYYTQPSNVPSARHDISNPNADVWGVSAEPWQDFAQPKQASSGVAGNASSGLAAPGSSRYSIDDRSGVNSSASSVFDMEAIMTGRTGNEPPVPRKPSPVPPGTDASVSPFGEPNYGEGMKRSKSLIKRIRSVRRE